ncbi:MAG TPA: hypothetical protein VFZ65_20620 [Planctomycetota bacterium]|nr:hypothetical protein [Planctomycetota bacterium]
MLDSNVWRYLVDYSSVSEVARWSRRSGVTIQVAPSVVYEALRSRDHGLRRQLLAFMTDSAWERVMPEAFEECQEILGEVRRLRPEWLRAQPDMKSLHRSRYDWSRPSGGFWDRLRHSGNHEAAILAALERDSLDVARREADARRAQVHALSLEKGVLNLSAMTATLTSPVTGWNGTPLQPWRVDALRIVTRVLQTAAKDEHPYFDWLAPVMDIDAATTSGPSWTRFWLHDVEAERMPRHWLRWAFERLASARRVNDGTPCDIQLATYLVTCDHFVSADRLFCDLIEACRPHCAARLPEVLRVAPGRDGTNSFRSFLKSVGG